MTLTPFGRFVFVAQWIMALALPIWVLGGRGILGVELGWMGVVGLFYAPIAIIALLAPAFTSLFDVEVRKTKTSRAGYSIAMTAGWAAMFLMGFVLPDANDDRALPSAFSKWFGIDEQVSSMLTTVCFFAAVAALLTALVLAIIGVQHSRKTAAA
jgi:hypothetical protein